MRVIFNVDAITAPLTGIGRYALELARGLARSAEIESLRLYSAYRWVDDPEHALHANRTIAAVRRHVPFQSAALEAYTQLRSALFRVHTRGMRDWLLHTPNYVLMPFAEERAVADAAGAELVIGDGANPTIRDAEVILTTWIRFPPEVLPTLERCRLIVRYGIGVDTIDLAAATACGIVVGNAPTYCVSEVADHAAGLSLTFHGLLDPDHRPAPGMALLRHPDLLTPVANLHRADLLSRL